jgi:predicted O-methyltransferase YrrM
MPVRGIPPTCAICGREGVTHAVVFDLYKFVCQPPIYDGACLAEANRRGWRMDGLLHGWGTDYEPEPEGGRVFLRAAVSTARTVLEWGAGYSTLDYPREAPYLRRWLTIEDTRIWTILVQEQGLPPKTSVLHLMGEEYFTAGRGTKWDVVVIDGHYRRRCLEEAWGILEPGGIVIAQDAEPGGETQWGGPFYDFEPWEHDGVYRYQHEGRTKEYRMLSHDPLEEYEGWLGVKAMVEVLR